MKQNQFKVKSKESSQDLIKEDKKKGDELWDRMKKSLDYNPIYRLLRLD